MIGPIFGAELLRAGRRGRTHYLRWLYAGWLVAQFLFAFSNYWPSQPAGPARGRTTTPKVSREPSAGETAAFARRFVDLILAQQFILIALVTPAFAAGAITDEKTRGTLQQLLTAYLRPAEIVVGKMLARACQVASLGLAALPMLTFFGPYAGLSFAFLFAWFVSTLLVVLGLSAASVLVSVWTKQTRTAAVIVYALMAGAYLIWEFVPAIAAAAPAWLRGFNPLYALEAAYTQNDWSEVGRRLGHTALAWGGLGLVSTLLATWRLRPAYIKQLTARPRTRLLPRCAFGRPALTGHPLMWKEAHARRRVPFWISLPLIAGVLGYFCFQSLLAVQGPVFAATGRSAEVLMSFGALVLMGLTLFVGVRTSGTITGERERQTWEALLTAPFSTRDLVRGKLNGILRGAWPYLISAYLGLALAAAFIHNDFIGSGFPWTMMTALAVTAGLAALLVWSEPWTLIWLTVAFVPFTAAFGGPVAFLFTLVGLAVTALSMYFMAAVGLWWSVRATGSWRSLLGTVTTAYVGGFVLTCASTPLACVTTATLSMLALLVEGAFSAAPIRGGGLLQWHHLIPLFASAGVALSFWWMASTLLNQAENYLSRHDRIPTDFLRILAYEVPERPARRTQRERVPT